LSYPPLASEPFQNALDLLHRFGNVKRWLKWGKNPLAYSYPVKDFLRLCDAARDELAADVGDVLRAANAGIDEGELSALAGLVVSRHDDRTGGLVSWLCDLGLSALYDGAGFCSELACAVANLADRQRDATLPSPAFATLTDALWAKLSVWH